MEILSLIAKFLLAPSIFFLSLAGYTVPQNDDYVALVQNSQMADEQSLGTTIANTVAGFETSLASSLTDSDTQMTLVSFTTGDGTTLTVGKKYAFTIDEGSASREFVIGTASSSNRIVDMVRGVSVEDGATEISANKKPHRRGASVKITNFQLVTITNILNDTATLPSPLRYASDVSTTSISNSQHLTSKAYVDSIAFNGAGVINASETARGIVELATQAEMASSTANGSVGPLVLQSRYATSTGGVAGFWTVITNSLGKIDGDFIDSTDIDLGHFGDGRDGTVTIGATSTVTLTRDMYYDNLTINGTLKTAGYRVFVKNTIDGSGAVVATGTPGTSGASNVPGVAGSSTEQGFFKISSGTSGTPGSTNVDCFNGSNSSSSYAGVAFTTLNTNTGGQGGSQAGGGCGGSGGTGGVGGSVVATATSTPYGFDYVSTINFYHISVSTSTLIVWSGGGGTGGGGGYARCVSTCNGTTADSGGGGGGGSAGGIVFIAARTFAGTFSINVSGGNGGNGGNGASEGDTTASGGGGGGGGTGGTIINLYTTKTHTGTLTVSGGTGGSAGSEGTGVQSGNNGATGQIFNIPITSLMQ